MHDDHQVNGSLRFGQRFEPGQGNLQSPNLRRPPRILLEELVTC